MLHRLMLAAFLFPFGSFSPARLPALKMWPLILLATLSGCATKNASAVAGTGTATPATADPAVLNAAAHAEQIRTECIHDRRLICGKVLKVVPGGLVVDSGYTSLLRPPLTQSWVVSGTVSAQRDPAALELNEPGTPCVGLVFLTNLPQRPKVQLFDYVMIMGYPAGQYVYASAPGVNKPIRKFSCGLDTAVRLVLQAETSQTPK